jgi:hypothetical protein
MAKTPKNEVKLLKKQLAEAQSEIVSMKTELGSIKQQLKVSTTSSSVAFSHRLSVFEFFQKRKSTDSQSPPRKAARTSSHSSPSTSSFKEAKTNFSLSYEVAPPVVVSFFPFLSCCLMFSSTFASFRTISSGCYTIIKNCMSAVFVFLSFCNGWSRFP